MRDQTENICSGSFIYYNHLFSDQTSNTSEENVQGDSFTKLKFNKLQSPGLPKSTVFLK